MKNKPIICSDGSEEYEVGLLEELDPGEFYNGYPPAIEVPTDFPLRQCYQYIDHGTRMDMTNRRNAHLLAVYGQLDETFIPVRIHPKFKDKPWAQLPVIEHIKVTADKRIFESDVWYGSIACVDQLTIEVTTSDGKIFRSAMPVSVKPSTDLSLIHQVHAGVWEVFDLYATRDAQNRCESDDLNYLLGGTVRVNDYEDIENDRFQKDMRDFWLNVSGPDQLLHDRLCQAVRKIDTPWSRLTLNCDGILTIQFKDGRRKTVRSKCPSSDPLTPDKKR